MNPTLTIFLFAMSLLAIAAAVALMLYIHGEIQRHHQLQNERDDEQPCPPRESTEVIRFLSRMRASTLVSRSAPRRNHDTDYDRN